MVLKHHPDKRGDGGGYSRERLDAVFTCIKHGMLIVCLMIRAVSCFLQSTSTQSVRFVHGMCVLFLVSFFSVPLHFEILKSYLPVPDMF